MSQPRERFDEALDLPAAERQAALIDLLANIDDQGAMAEDLELKAVITSVLAEHDSEYVERARALVSRADCDGSGGWPNYYLAATLLRIGGHAAEALAQLERIPPEFFERRDLGWRATHVVELQIVARVQLGDDELALQLADLFSADLAARGDIADLAPPVELVSAVLKRVDTGTATDAVRRIARGICESIDVESWLGAEAARRLAEVEWGDR